MPRFLKIHMWPIWVLGIFGQAKSFKANPIIGSRILNLLGLHVLRVTVSHLIAKLRFILLSPLISHDLRKEYQENGFIKIENFISANRVLALITDFKKLDGPARQMVQGDTLTQRILLDDKTIANCAHLRTLITDRTYNNLLAYSGAKWHPSLIYIQRIRNNMSGGDKVDPQKTMHSDAFHPSMKAWLFLEDVALDQGPFNYVAGSHKLTWKRLKWEYKRSISVLNNPDGYSEKGSMRADPEDLVEMDLPSPTPMVVKAGTLVIGNTNGFHGRGQANGPQSRLEIWAYSRHNPFNPLPGFNFKWLSNLEKSALQKFWRYKDNLAKKKNSRASWHIIDTKDMFDGVAELREIDHHKGNENND